MKVSLKRTNCFVLSYFFYFLWVRDVAHGSHLLKTAVKGRERRGFCLECRTTTQKTRNIKPLICIYSCILEFILIEPNIIIYTYDKTLSQMYEKRALSHFVPVQLTKLLSISQLFRVTFQVGERDVKRFTVLINDKAAKLATFQFPCRLNAIPKWFSI